MMAIPPKVHFGRDSILLEIAEPLPCYLAISNYHLGSWLASLLAMIFWAYFRLLF